MQIFINSIYNLDWIVNDVDIIMHGFVWSEICEGKS